MLARYDRDVSSFCLAQGLAELGVVVRPGREFGPRDCPRRGTALFEEVLQEWGRLVGIYGPAMVQLRSRRGYLERLDAGDTVIVVVRDAWERPIRSVLRALKIADEHFDYALFLCNLLFDPREILDLRRRAGSTDASLGLLTSAYYAALVGSCAGAGPHEGGPSA